ncbi:MAG TPA: class I tRNA ligase family protein, partial [Blastocatellia bacterium]|nr:class I tRNA ligase family protein [Blastocatellia bacterium]
HNDKAPFDGAKIDYWLPVDQYIGGIEHAVLHLIYTRYWTKVMRDLELVELDEPIQRLLTQGMVCMETYKCPEHDWLFPDQVSDRKTCLICGKPVEVGRIEKMSKSKKNTLDPDEMIARYGADALRVFVLFAGPPEKDMEWTEGGIEGASRYLQRVWRIGYKWRDQISGVQDQDRFLAGSTELTEPQRKLRRRTHQIIRSVTENMEERLHLNTCISSLMELTNEIYDFDGAVAKSGTMSATDGATAKSGATSAMNAAVAREAFEALIRMLVPFAPHIAEEIWESMGHTESLAFADWPAFDSELAQEDRIEVPVQINGKIRSKVYVGAGASEDEMREAALQDEKVKSATAGREVVKVIVVPKKLVNLVLR